MKLFLALLSGASLAVLTNAHGYYVTPPARQAGKAFEAACGQQAYDNMAANINGNIQGLEEIVATQSDYHPEKCHLWKCKGLKYADNTANVQTYSPGETVQMHFDIQAPHDGYANISIISLEGDTGSIIAKDLKYWPHYALTSVPIKHNQEFFSIKMPTTLGSQCDEPGHCAIQMHWNAPSIDQTYQSCIDFKMSGSSGKRDVAEPVEGLQRLHARDFNWG
jgi:hypothetical protein